MSNKKTNLRRNFIFNLIGSSVYAVTSLLFLIIATRVNGLEEAGVFTFAFSNACVFQVFGLYAGRTFQVTEKDESFSDGVYFYNRLLSTFGMILFGLIFCLVRGYSGFKFLIILLLIVYKALDAFAEVIYGVLQKHDKLYQVGLSLLFKGLLAPLAFLAVDLASKNLELASLALICSSLLVMVCYDFPMLKRDGFSLKKPDWSRAFALFRLGFFAFAFTLLTQYLINASKYAIDSRLDSYAQTIYGIIAMPATVMILAANFLVHPYLTKIKSFLASQNLAGLRMLVRKLVGFVSIFGFLTTVAGALLGEPVFLLLYGVDTFAHLLSLVIILIGATLYALTFVLSNVLTAMRQTASQAAIFAVASLFALILSEVLVVHYGISGGALAYALSMFVLLLFYLLIYFNALKKEAIAHVR